MRHGGYRIHFATYVLAMMADNIEHVISYWVVFQKFHSPALGGFAVLSHWLPFLLFSVPVGALADRFDPRRIIQAGMLLFITASLGWGYFFVTDTLQMWHAMLLLVIHGSAGVLWQTSSQLLLHDIVPAPEMQSAVRLNATARYLVCWSALRSAALSCCRLGRRTASCSTRCSTCRCFYGCGRRRTGRVFARARRRRSARCAGWPTSRKRCATSPGSR